MKGELLPSEASWAESVEDKRCRESEVRGEQKGLRSFRSEHIAMYLSVSENEKLPAENIYSLV
jgi:hypothetical protein